MPESQPVFDLTAAINHHLQDTNQAIGTLLGSLDAVGDFGANLSGILHQLEEISAQADLLAMTAALGPVAVPAAYLESQPVALENV